MWGSPFFGCLQDRHSYQSGMSIQPFELRVYGMLRALRRATSLWPCWPSGTIPSQLALLQSWQIHTSHAGSLRPSHRSGPCCFLCSHRKHFPNTGSCVILICFWLVFPRFHCLWRWRMRCASLDGFRKMLHGGMPLFSPFHP